MAATSLSRLVSQTGTKTFAPTPVSGKKQADCETCLEMLDFRSPWQLIRNRRGNPLGTLIVDLDSINEYRKKTIKENQQRQPQSH